MFSCICHNDIGQKEQARADNAVLYEQKTYKAEECDLYNEMSSAAIGALLSIRPVITEVN